MLESITSFKPLTVSGTLSIDNQVVNVNVTETSIYGSLQFKETPGFHLSVSVDIATGKTSVSYTHDDPASTALLVEELTEKLLLIKTELSA